MPKMQRRAPAQTRWALTASDYESARHARSEFSSFMRRFSIPEDALHESALIFGELVGNAVRHVGGEVRIRLFVAGTQPVLCVTDCAADSVLEVADRGPSSEAGRGLQIVRTLARAFWIEREAGSKSIYAALPCDIPGRVHVERGDVSR